MRRGTWLFGSPQLDVFCRGFNKHPCCLVKGGYPKKVGAIQINSMGVYYFVLNIVRKESQHTISHIQHIFWGDFLVPFFFRKVSSIPITSCHIPYSFFPWLSDSSHCCIKNFWQEMGFKIKEILRYLTLFPSLPGLCGIVASTWKPQITMDFVPSKLWMCFFCLPSCLYLLSRLIPVIKWIKSKWSKCRKIITTSHSCIGEVKLAVPSGYDDNALRF